METPTTDSRRRRHHPRPETYLQHPEWTRDAVIYQLNQRHLTPEGTLRAAEAHLGRIRDLGADIVWLMPVNPIGDVNRKGSLGSPYAVRNHRAVNPELGTMEDLRHFVATAHGLGLRVILDWVANHTAWDNVLVAEHPKWFVRSWTGDFRPTPWWDWDDVIDLDFNQADLREYMGEAMAHFVREADVDGFRCDVAGFVPLDFWETVREQLEEIKPVFMLAEWEARDLHVHAFDASYAWTWNRAIHRIAQGDADLEPLRLYYAWNAKAWPRDAMRMTFVTNHDINAWEGTEFEQFGEALDAAIVLSVVGEGIPAIYSGQEAGSDRRLRFFDKDQIEWRDHPQGELYRRLFALKKAHPALWNGSWGSSMEPVPNSAETAVLSFVRRTDDDTVLAVLNLSDQPRSVTLGSGPYAARLREAFSGDEVDAAPGMELNLPSWGFQVLTS